jgi:hypothetical protein
MIILSNLIHPWGYALSSNRQDFTTVNCRFGQQKPIAQGYSGALQLSEMLHKQEDNPSDMAAYTDDKVTINIGNCNDPKALSKVNIM